MTIRELLDSNTNSFSHLVVKSTEGDVLYDGPCADILTKSLCLIAKSLYGRLQNATV